MVKAVRPSRKLACTFEEHGRKPPARRRPELRQLMVVVNLSPDFRVTSSEACAAESPRYIRVGAGHSRGWQIITVIKCEDEAFADRGRDR